MAKKHRLIHTSPEKIEQIHDKGLFGSGLFFSHKPYYMGSESGSSMYGHEVDDSDIIGANDFSYLEQEDYKKIRPIVQEIMDLLEVDEGMALDLLSENENATSLLSSLEDEQYQRSIQDEDEDEDEEKEWEDKKQLLKKLKTLDLGDFEWDIQKKALQAANLLGKRGVELRDEQGASYLINMLGRERQLRPLNDDSYQSFLSYEDEDEDLLSKNIQKRLDDKKKPSAMYF